MAAVTGILRTSAFATHVAQGLTRRPKALSSAWLYDDEGSRLFERIMSLPEYYPTRAEARLLAEQGDALVAALVDGTRPIDLVEMGSGNGEKTLTLCQALARRGAAWTYRPIDLSQSALRALGARFRRTMPGARVLPLHGTWTDPWPPAEPGHRRVVLFMGSNLGNLRHDDAIDLLSGVRRRLAPRDLLVLGLDLQKDPRKILAAYDDAQGVTARFNLNLLVRLNRELGMDFDLSRFAHYATYCPLDGAARSYLVSTRRQRVRSTVLGRSFEFEEGETIHTEQSRKYTPEGIDRMAVAAGFVPKTRKVDARDLYSVDVWEVPE
jgi:dimethylhistidine N-methyltransferase